MSERNLVILTKIILFYSIFFIGMKIVVMFQGAWLIPNMLLALPFLILALISGIMVWKKTYSWILVFVGAATIILIRIYETQLVVWLQQQIAG